jgi:hypothetical protein
MSDSEFNNQQHEFDGDNIETMCMLASIVDYLMLTFRASTQMESDLPLNQRSGVVKNIKTQK